MADAMYVHCLTAGRKTVGHEWMVSYLVSISEITAAALGSMIWRAYCFFRYDHVEEYYNFWVEFSGGLVITHQGVNGCLSWTCWQVLERPQELGIKGSQNYRG
jgi:hypothetical protein